MSFPGSGPLLRYAGKQLGHRVVREFGLPSAVGDALGLPPQDGPAQPRVAPPLRALDREAEQAIGERAFQAALSYLGKGGWSEGQQSALAQAIAHAVVEAFDEYQSRGTPAEAPTETTSGTPTQRSDE